jgi:hypothetical protein
MIGEECMDEWANGSEGDWVSRRKMVNVWRIPFEEKGVGVGERNIMTRVVETINQQLKHYSNQGS